MGEEQNNKNVSIVIVTHNSEVVIEKCLESIPGDTKVYVVDNASSDYTCEIVHNATGNITLIDSHENLGFGPANNVALEQITEEFALLLNPDTVLNTDSIEKMVEAANKYENAAIIAPMLLHEGGASQHSYKQSVFKREKAKSNYIKPDGDLCAEFLSGAVMLLRMKYFKDIGFFDPNIFLFYEDDDICLKVRQAGYSLVLTTASEVMHLAGQSSPQSFRYIYRKERHLYWSRLYLEKKYKGLTSALKTGTKLILIQAFKAFFYALTLNKRKTLRSFARVAGSLLFLAGKS